MMKRTVLILCLLLFSCRDDSHKQDVISTPPTDVTAGQITLAWDAPTTYADGSILDDGILVGYKVYYGTTSGDYSMITDVGNVTTYAVNDLMPGTYYFAVTAYNVYGNESDYSSEVEKNLSS